MTYTYADVCVAARTAPMLAALLLLAGCAGGVSKQDAANYDALLAQGNYRDAAQVALAAGQIQPGGSSKNLAWSLGAGAALLYSGDAPKSMKVLAGAEDLMALRDNDDFTNTQYDYATYDGIMTDVYQGLGTLANSRTDDAQVFFNRVGDRQRRAEEKFAADKEKLDAAAQQKASGQFDLTSALRNAEASAEYKAANDEIGNFGNYRPFINPAASYISAISRLSSAQTDSDFENARTELRRVHDMLGKAANPSVEKDLLWANSRKGTPGAKVWVVFENGQAPTFAEYRITFPVPVIGKVASRPALRPLRCRAWSSIRLPRARWSSPPAASTRPPWRWAASTM